MEAAATINVRLPEELKRAGGKVLERNGVSPTDLVRSVYRYLYRNQALPECLDVAPSSADTVYQARRAMLRRYDGFKVEAVDSDSGSDRASRIEGKYGDLL